MASAPPSAAPAVAIVVRSMLDQGSRRAIMRQAVTAVTWVEGTPALAASAILAMIRRAALILAIVRNTSASACRVTAIEPSTAEGAMPSASPALRNSTMVPAMAASSSASLAPAE